MNKFFKYIFLSTGIFILASCHRNDFEADDSPQEEITNILLNVTDTATNVTNTYNYSLGVTTNPVIKLEDGHTYSTSLIFLNGNSDETESIKKAKNEHFLIYNFPNSEVLLSRTDDESSTRADGKKVGLKTLIKVNKTTNGNNPQLIITLYHEPQTVSEEKNGTSWGMQTKGETDAYAIYRIAKP